MMLNDPKVLMAIAFILGMTLVSLSEVANPGYGPVPGIGMIVLGGLWFTSIFAWVYAKHDAALIKEGEHINHPIRFLIRALVLGAFSFIALRCFCWDILWLTIFQGAVFWILFDIFLNKLRGKSWDYVSTWYGSSWLDKIYKGYWIPWMVTKVVILVWSIIFLG